MPKVRYFDLDNGCVFYLNQTNGISNLFAIPFTNKTVLGTQTLVASPEVISYDVTYPVPNSPLLHVFMQTRGSSPTFQRVPFDPIYLSTFTPMPIAKASSSALTSVAVASRYDLELSMFFVDFLASPEILGFEQSFNPSESGTVNAWYYGYPLVTATNMTIQPSVFAVRSAFDEINMFALYDDTLGYRGLYSQNTSFSVIGPPSFKHRAADVKSGSDGLIYILSAHLETDYRGLEVLNVTFAIFGDDICFHPQKVLAGVPDLCTCTRPIPDLMINNIATSPTRCAGSFWYFNVSAGGTTFPLDRQFGDIKPFF
jgi:hypothetical protein